MYQIALCEDTDYDRDIMVENLEKVFSYYALPYTLKRFNSGEAFLSAIQPYAYDIVFFDVEMAKVNGIEAARRLREVDQSVIIVFTTVCANGVFSSFAVEPLQYLIKPIQYDQLREVVGTAVAKINESRKEAFAFSFNGTMHSIPIRRIRYFESKGRTVEVVTAKARLPFYSTLNEVQQTKGLSSFIRCHQSFLVNPTAIKQINVDTVLLFTGETIALSKKRAKESKESFMNYITDLTM